MRVSRAPLFKFAACFAMLAFLLGVTPAGSAEREERAKEPRSVQKPVKRESLYTGPYKGVPFFFNKRTVSQCSSSCCTAYASCNGPASTSCSEAGCTATCPQSGATSTYTCSPAN